jgi:hypothetical protein
VWYFAGYLCRCPDVSYFGATGHQFTTIFCLKHATCTLSTTIPHTTHDELSAMLLLSTAKLHQCYNIYVVLFIQITIHCVTDLFFHYYALHLHTSCRLPPQLCVRLNRFQLIVRHCLQLTLHHTSLSFTALSNAATRHNCITYMTATVTLNNVTHRYTTKAHPMMMRFMQTRTNFGKLLTTFETRRTPGRITRHCQMA